MHPTQSNEHGCVIIRPLACRTKANYVEFLDHPQVQETGLVSWLDHAGVGRVPVPNVPGLKPFDARGDKASSPGVGEHSREVLSDLGYTSEQIDDFAARKITLA